MKSGKKRAAGRAAKRHKELNVNRIIQHDCENCNSIVKKVWFNSSQLIAIESDNQRFIAIRPICEAIGISFSRQSRKLQRDSKFSCAHMATTGADGKQYQMLCLPMEKLNAWLFSINAARCRPETQDRIRLFQNECCIVLHDYFNKGYAVNPQATAPQLENLFNQVKEMQFELGYQKHRLELFDSIVECGTISKSTGNPRIVPVRGTYRSLPRKGKRKQDRIQQLSFLKALFRR